MMGGDDLPTDPEMIDFDQTCRKQLESQPGLESAHEVLKRAEDARAAADDPFDRLRAELRRPEQTGRGWRHRRPWRWLAGWWRKPGDDRRP